MSMLRLPSSTLRARVNPATGKLTAHLPHLLLVHQHRLFGLLCLQRPDVLLRHRVGVGHQLLNHGLLLRFHIRILRPLELANLRGTVGLLRPLRVLLRLRDVHLRLVRLPATGRTCYRVGTLRGTRRRLLERLRLRPCVLDGLLRLHLRPGLRRVDAAALLLLLLLRSLHLERPLRRLLRGLLPRATHLLLRLWLESTGTHGLLILGRLLMLRQHTLVLPRRDTAGRRHGRRCGLLTVHPVLSLQEGLLRLRLILRLRLRRGLRRGLSCLRLVVEFCHWLYLRVDGLLEWCTRRARTSHLAAALLQDRCPRRHVHARCSGRGRRGLHGRGCRLDRPLRPGHPPEPARNEGLAMVHGYFSMSAGGGMGAGGAFASFSAFAFMMASMSAGAYFTAYLATVFNQPHFIR
jgi:hypothetical protein